MSSFKTVSWSVSTILLFGIIAVFAEEIPSATVTTDTIPKGNCSCGGFPTSTPAVDEEPILSQTPGLVVKCDDEGGNTCKSLCYALAIATKAKGPEILCNKLKAANELKLSAFFKICDRPWTYADITAEKPLCCDNTKVKMCLSMEKFNTTAEGDLTTTEAKTVL